MGWLTSIFFGPEKTTNDVLASNSVEVADIYHTTAGDKILPSLVSQEVEAKPSSDMTQLEIWLTLKNESPYDVEITKVELLGQKINPARYLKASESYEIRVFRGLTPRTNVETKAFIEVKVSGTGDYFRQQYTIEYDLEQENGTNWYIPRNLKKALPPQDI